MVIYSMLKTVINCGCWAHLRREFLKTTGRKRLEEGTELRKGFDLMKQSVVQKRLYKPPLSGKIKKAMGVLLWQGKKKAGYGR